MPTIIIPGDDKSPALRMGVSDDASTNIIKLTRLLERIDRHGHNTTDGDSLESMVEPSTGEPVFF